MVSNERNFKATTTSCNKKLVIKYKEFIDNQLSYCCKIKCDFEYENKLKFMATLVYN